MRLYRGCLDLVVMSYLSNLISPIRAWPSLGEPLEANITSARLYSACTELDPFSHRALCILVSLRRSSHVLAHLRWSFCLPRHSHARLLYLDIMNLDTSLSQLTSPRHHRWDTWQPLTEPSQPQKMGATRSLLWVRQEALLVHWQTFGTYHIFWRIRLRRASMWAKSILALLIFGRGYARQCVFHRILRVLPSGW